MRRSLLHLFLLSILSGCASAIAKPKKALRINWNSSYYTGEFQPCKPLRIMNAVEKMKAQKAAVDTFRQCGSKLMSLAAFKYKYPAFAISTGLKFFCLLYTYVFAYVANDGGLIISPQTESDYLRELARRFACAAVVPGNEVSVKNGKTTYIIPKGLIEEGGSFFFRCVLPNKLTTWIDGDVAKYSVSHHKSMLL